MSLEDQNPLEEIPGSHRELIKNPEILTRKKKVRIAPEPLNYKAETPIKSTALEPKLMKVNKTYMELSDEEFLSLGLTGCRQGLANMLRSKVYTIVEILLILIYTALIVLYLTFDGDLTD